MMQVDLWPIFGCSFFSVGLAGECTFIGVYIGLSIVTDMFICNSQGHTYTSIAVTMCALQSVIAHTHTAPNI